MTLLQTNALSVSIAGQSICRQLTLQLEPNQVWGILGANGVGKTTLLHTLAGLRPADSGEIQLCGEELSRLKRRQIARKLGVLLQQQFIQFPASVMETALSGRHPYLHAWQWESDKDIAIAKRALSLMELTSMEQRAINTLSGGEQQRLKVATLITQQPQVMLLDEPTNHLDLHHQIKLLTLLCEHNNKQQGAVAMVLHDLNLAARFCSHILLLIPDQEPISGLRAEVMQPQLLERAYRWPVKQIEAEDTSIYLPA